jgi:hypothetical protein
MSQDERHRISLAEARAARAGRPEAAAAYEQARLRFELAEASADGARHWACHSGSSPNEPG